MPQCLKCGAELPVNEEGMAPVLCDRCAGRATRRARVGMNTGTLREFPATTILTGINVAVFTLMVLASGSFWEFGGRTLYYFGGNYGPATLTGDYWRLITAGLFMAVCFTSASTCGVCGIWASFQSVSLEAGLLLPFTCLPA